MGGRSVPYKAPTSFLGLEMKEARKRRAARHSHINSNSYGRKN